MTVASREIPADLDPDDVAGFIAAMEGHPGGPHAVPVAGAALDWRTLWTEKPEPVDWLVDPLIARGRLVALYSTPKAGKSLLALELAAAISTGRPALGRATRPARVLYLDMENDPRGDVLARLRDMGHTPDTLDALRVYSFPTLAPLDTPAGGRELLNWVQHERADLVIIDTVSRTVQGEENENSTWLQWYRHTGLPLKRAGVACLRLDHAGKDAAKGQRGGSAKAADVDAVWKLTATRDTVRLICEATRQPLPDTDRVLTLHRQHDPLRHVRALDPAADARTARVAALVAVLDGLHVDPTAGRPTAQKALREAGHKASTEDLIAAMSERREPVRTTPGQPTPTNLSEPLPDNTTPNPAKPQASNETSLSETQNGQPRTATIGDLSERPPYVVGAASGHPNPKEYQR